MRDTDLLDRRVPVQVGDRIFSFRRLTVGALLRILVRFDAQLRFFAEGGATDVTGLLNGLDNDDTADLWALMMEPYEPAYLRKFLDMKTATELVALAGTLNDLKRIWKSLSFPVPGEAKSAEEPVTEKAIPPMLATVDAIAGHYHIDPFGLMEWPYEGFLTITEIMNERASQKERAALREIFKSYGLDPKFADVPGMRFSPVAGDLKREH